MAKTNQGRTSGQSVRTPSNEVAGRLFGQSTRKSGLDADWNQVDSTVLHRIVWAVDFLGGAVTFSTTKANSAYCVKVYMGQPYDPMYFDGDDEGRAALAAWAEQLVEAAAEHG